MAVKMISDFKLFLDLRLFLFFCKLVTELYSGLATLVVQQSLYFKTTH